MKELDIYKQTARMFAFLVLSILFSKMTNGYGVPLLAIIGIWCAFSNKLGWALVYFVLMPFYVILSPSIMPKNVAIVGYALRFGPLLIGLVLAMMGARRQGRHRLPFIAIIPFMMVAVISSAGGWAPMVSYLKIVNFIIFLLGIWFGTQNLQHRPKDVFLLRSFFLAIAVFIILGSIVVMPFPSISYATGLGNALQEGGVELANEVYQKRKLAGVANLFCGITNQSQALSPLLACIFAWVACDMIFLERRFRKPHLILLGLAVPLMYLTRSRLALVSMAFVVVVLFCYALPKVRLPPAIRARITQGMVVGFALLMVAAVALQLKSGGLTRWIRKSNDQTSDKRSLGEALTQSRQELMRYSLYEFHRNPVFGSGFQVDDKTADKVSRVKGLVISASVEKGVLPVMVLGETGIMGVLCFLFFLGAFYFECSKRRYHVTLTIFAVFLVTNMGEATFFSPGGMGGILWMMACVGGFTIDTTLLFRRNIEQEWQNLAMMGMPRPGLYGPQRPLGLR